MYKRFGKRLSYEADLLKNMSPDEIKDLLINGEKQLGKLYANGKMATVRREWRGVKDTGVDFYEWGRMWAMLLATFSFLFRYSFPWLLELCKRGKHIIVLGNIRIKDPDIMLCHI